jgi:group I intron endonuclease
VYRVANDLNGKVYVGVTTKSLNERWKHHVFSSKNNDLVFGAAIRKYGEDRFTMEVLEECESRQHMLEREKFWIEELNSHVSQGCGYNMTMGGEGVFGYNHTEEAKRSMSEKRKGAQNHNFGKRWGREAHPPEFLEMMSKRHSGAGNPMFGRKHSEETRRKIAAANKRRTYTGTAVLQFDLEGNFMKRFESTQAAARSVEGSGNKILMVCKGERKTHKKHMWRYATGGVSSAS